jgi:hypothetical protein
MHMDEVFANYAKYALVLLLFFLFLLFFCTVYATETYIWEIDDYYYYLTVGG